MRIEPTFCLTFMSLISLSTSTTKLNYIYISLYPIVKYLLVTSFPRSVYCKLRTEFFLADLWPKREARRP